MRIAMQDPSATQSGPGKRSVLSETAVFLACILALIFAADVYLLLMTGKGAERRDFISYWAAGQQLAHHANPYDASATLTLERSLGFPPAGEALIVRNPPWALPLVAPLGYFSFRFAAVLWSVALLVCWLASIRILLALAPAPAQRYKVLGYPITPAFILALFAPALTCIFYGQTAVFALLGLVLFLRFHKTHPALAGLSLWLCALKPHLFLPFAAVLLLWAIHSVITQRNCHSERSEESPYSFHAATILASAIAALTATSLLANHLDPHAFREYLAMMRHATTEREFIPCIGIALRFAINPALTSIEYIPAALASLWAIAFYWRNRLTWDWTEHGPLLALVSLVFAPYAWLTDQVIALPALLIAARIAGLRALVLIALAGAIIEAEVLANIYMHSALFLWTAPAWLALYAFAVRNGSASHQKPLNG
jgi:hypothetical protein